ncbi:phosphomevalonate kinase [Exophiala oligosperma]|uniref:Phosphomevalonate kinase n=2 Tax=Chaetothyriales TaxID=34395 RepID=A0A0D2AIY3_9EURO|nr:phosphomevalonate kinase [Exophiala oligosperma]KAJ9639139.1 phosphomevalonate kinase [Knufia peltigerae]KIW40071.1 phosphomevalonate kinase [Exophiala oligosperma]
MSPSSVAVSAPGKVLFAGGFLVLDRKHTGVVFGLNARIHARVEPWNDKPRSLKGEGERHILVQSPQFLEAKWLYRVGSSNTPDSSSEEEDVAVNVEQVPMTTQDDDEGGTASSTTTNKFVETTLRYVLTYVSSRGRQHVTTNDIKITVLADDDYYSQSSAASKSSTTTPFTSFGVKLRNAHKTGLGSSAALVTSLVAALLAFYLEENGGDDAASLPPQKVIHNLAQAAHCAAQGKVGSGFDVAAAVYGSCLYRRFTPAILEAVGEPSSPGFRDRLRLCVDDLELNHKWDVEVAGHAIKIPDGLILVMCDVDCGSETPGMVRKVLQWRKEKAEEAGLLWNAIQQGSDDLCQELRRLSEVDGVVAQAEEDGPFKGLGDILLTVRSLVREMSAKSEVPVEPPVITELLDYCTSLPGVVGGVAPGAGGYDAVALLIKSDVDVVRGLREKLDGWKGQDDSGATIGHVRLLGVKQAKEGMRREDVGQYAEWV